MGKMDKHCSSAGAIPADGAVALWSCVTRRILNDAGFQTSNENVPKKRVEFFTNLINVDKLTVAVYTFCGFCASIAALIMVGRTNAAQPGAGSSYSFDCMTAACLGGVSIAGGEGKISGTVIGVIILGILDNGLVLMSVNTNWQSVIKGLILLAAVAIDCYQVVNKNKKKAAA